MSSSSLTHSLAAEEVRRAGELVPAHDERGRVRLGAVDDEDQSLDQLVRQLGCHRHQIAVVAQLRVALLHGRVVVVMDVVDAAEDLDYHVPERQRV